ncbi:MAG: Eco57I restriction-modification methylase domain-containing protein [Lentimicrobiaceae bacterium]|nr:Eco57I restriction-modification methylase domain-containing protein [Lentimicrobiaceae bacterium]
MEKKQAQDYIKQVLNSRFDQEQFELFVRNLLNEFEPRDNNYSGNLIPEAFRDHIAHYKRIGKYTDPEGEPMDILIVQTRSVNKLERTRTALRNFVVRHLKNFDKYYALVAFYSKEDNGEEWRLSLVKIDIEQERTDKGKIKAKEEIVPAKRFSYLVGVHEDAYTAQKQLLPLFVNDHSNPLVVKEKDGDGSIEGAFSIEKVTDEFYEQYKELYLKLTENARLTKALEKEGLDSVRFVKKLLGQIVFLYFLQKKGWLGVPKDQKMGTGSKRFLQDRFLAVEEAGGNYFNDFLRYLFYAALAREHNDESIKYYFKRLSCKIPFLNGGLFEADYAWEKANISIPNELFRNSEKNKAGDKGTGILDVFDRYNFTIKEDEPLEKEVAVDPEMLGKVFENMLEITERKSKGAFYTPREIVHYMCQESLIHYLDNTVNEYTESYQTFDSDQTSLFGRSTNKKGSLKIELKNEGDIHVPKEDIDQLIRQGHLVLEHEATATGKGKETKSYKHKLPESIRKNAKTLDAALANIKICDPAIGSGAFPVGMLQEIVTTRLVLNSFLQNEKHTPYFLKRHAIQESIYGVDIDASAIDIARLRLWLSMIVDEEDYDTIEALPNLDYKIVKGDSLVGFLFDSVGRTSVLDQVEKLKEKMITETDQSEKESIRAKVRALLDPIYQNSAKGIGYYVDFDYRYEFSEVFTKGRKGFDLVIGNPPYIQIQKLDEKLKKTLSKLQFKTFSSSGDIYELFYEKGNNVLAKGGHLCYITSNKWLRANYGKSTRQYFLTKTNPKVLFDFGQEMVFASAIVHSNVLLFQNARFQNQFWGCQMSKGKLNGQALEQYFDEFAIPLDYFTEEVWAISTPELIKSKSVLESNGLKLGKWKINFRRGVLTGFNPAFIIGERTKKEIITNDHHSEEIIKPILRGRDTRRFYCNFSKLYIICTFPTKQLAITDFQGVKSHLETFDKRKLEQSGREFINSEGEKDKSRKATKHKWFETQDSIAYFSEFEKPKIVFSEIVSEPQFYYDTQKYYPEATAFLITGESLKWLTAFLNSEPITVLFRIFYAGGELVGKYRYKKAFLENLPIPEPIPENEPVVETLVDYLSAYKGKYGDRSKEQLTARYFELVVDGLVYEIILKDQIAAAKKQILPHLGDLKPFTDEMSEEEKLSIIQSEFERLYDPNHPVRNNLETLDSVEEVRIIKEALK